GKMEEADEGFERCLELCCPPRSAGADRPPLSGSHRRTKDACTRSGGETDGLRTQIRDPVAQSCARKRDAYRAPAPAHVWLRGARGTLSGLANHPVSVCEAPDP